MATEYKNIIIKKGLQADTPALSEGELGLQTDTGKVLIGTATGNRVLADSEHIHKKADITDFAHKHVVADITDFPATMPPTAHTHDNDYHTKMQITNLLSAKISKTQELNKLYGTDGTGQDHLYNAQLFLQRISTPNELYGNDAAGFPTTFSTNNWIQKSSQPNKVYGTDGTGNQAMLSMPSGVYSEVFIYTLTPGHTLNVALLTPYNHLRLVYRKKSASINGNNFEDVKVIDPSSLSLQESSAFTVVEAEVYNGGTKVTPTPSTEYFISEQDAIEYLNTMYPDSIGKVAQLNIGTEVDGYIAYFKSSSVGIRYNGVELSSSSLTNVGKLIRQTTTSVIFTGDADAELKIYGAGW